MANSYYTEIVADQNYTEMLDGVAYRWFDFQQLAAEGTKDYLIYIPPSPTSLLFYGRAFAGRTSDLKLEVYSNPVFTSEGTLMNDRIQNRNADHPSNAQSLIWQDPVLTSDGTLSDYDETSGSVSSSSGSKGSTGSQTSQEFPRIMPKDTYILARVTNISTTNPANYVYKLFWSEVKG